MNRDCVEIDSPIPILMDRTMYEMRKLGDEIAEASAHIDAATYKLLTMIATFDKKEGWDGWRSCAHWLNWRTGLQLSTAREKVRVARALTDLPKISEEMQKGKLSYSKVRAITRVATPENEEGLLTFALAGTASHVERVVRAWRKADAPAELELAKKQITNRYLEYYTDQDGMFVIKGRLTPEAGAVLQKALEAAGDVLYNEIVSKEPEGEEKKNASAGTFAVNDENSAKAFSHPRQKRADAMELVAESSLTNKLDNGTRGDRFQVVLHVDRPVLLDPEKPGLTQLEDGPSVSPETSLRISCDAAKVVMTHDEKGNVLDIGRKSRVIPPAIMRALKTRDQGCRFPGCGIKFCVGHHLKHWAKGGETKLSNLILLCRFHHSKVHEVGFSVEQTHDGKLRFLTPEGRDMGKPWEPPEIKGDALARMMDENREEGLEIDKDTSTPYWRGEPLDLDLALSSLMPQNE